MLAQGGKLSHLSSDESHARPMTRGGEGAALAPTETSPAAPREQRQSQFDQSPSNTEIRLRAEAELPPPQASAFRLEPLTSQTPASRPRLLLHDAESSLHMKSVSAGYAALCASIVHLPEEKDIMYSSFKNTHKSVWISLHLLLKY